MSVTADNCLAPSPQRASYELVVVRVGTDLPWEDCWLAQAPRREHEGQKRREIHARELLRELAAGPVILVQDGHRVDQIEVTFPPSLQDAMWGPRKNTPETNTFVSRTILTASPAQPPRLC